MGKTAKTMFVALLVSGLSVIAADTGKKESKKEKRNPATKFDYCTKAVKSKVPSRIDDPTLMDAEYARQMKTVVSECVNSQVCLDETGEYSISGCAWNEKAHQCEQSPYARCL